MVSKRDNIATHHLYQAWDPVPSLSPATTGKCLCAGGRGEWVSFTFKKQKRNSILQELKPFSYLLCYACFKNLLSVLL